MKLFVYVQRLNPKHPWRLEWIMSGEEDQVIFLWVRNKHLSSVIPTKERRADYFLNKKMTQNKFQKILTVNC